VMLIEEFRLCDVPCNAACTQLVTTSPVNNNNGGASGGTRLCRHCSVSVAIGAGVDVGVDGRVFIGEFERGP